MTPAFPQVYPQATLIRWDAYSVVFAWVILATGMLLWVLGLLFRLPLGSTLTWLFVIFMVAALPHLVLAFMHKCPACGKHPTIQGFTPVHPASAKQSKLRGWAGVVVRVVANESFICIHCGTAWRCA
jgi:predicted RNA-binding Zn-ribbon protein involved in translation (DUF1610 family)